MDEALVALGRYLVEHKYDFTTVTPDSHRRYLAKKVFSGDALRDLLGWNLSIPKDRVPPSVLGWLSEARAAEVIGDSVRSLVRYSTCGDSIFLHSGFPTVQKDSVFFGPDSYRFVRFVRDRILPGKNVADIGGGSGVGGLSLSDKRHEILITDVNERALAFTKINSLINGIEVKTQLSDILKNVPRGFQTLIANPPFIMDREKRKYRDGGENFGTELSIKIAGEALDYLAPGGQLLLYTATCFVGGRDVFLERFKALAERRNDVSFDYQEIDPDIFGEELSEPGYEAAERIAAIGLDLRIK